MVAKGKTDCRTSDDPLGRIGQIRQRWLRLRDDLRGHIDVAEVDGADSDTDLPAGATDPVLCDRGCDGRAGESGIVTSKNPWA